MPINKNVTLEMFMAQNAAQPAQKDFVVSERFKDADGQPIPWKLHAISGSRDAQLRRECSQGAKFDNIKYVTLLAAATVRAPDLKSAALQDSYHAHGEAELLEKMLTAAELNQLTIQVQIVNGYVKDVDDLIAQAKNL